MNHDQTIVVLIVAAAFWVIGSFCIFCTPSAFVTDDEAYEALYWWPLVILKLALKALYRVLFTGWRD